MRTLAVAGLVLLAPVSGRAQDARTPPAPVCPDGRLATGPPKLPHAWVCSVSSEAPRVVRTMGGDWFTWKSTIEFFCVGRESEGVHRHTISMEASQPGRTGGANLEGAQKQIWKTFAKILLAECAPPPAKEGPEPSGSLDPGAP